MATYLSRTSSSSPTGTTTWTFSAWIKRSGFTPSSSQKFFSAGSSSSDRTEFYLATDGTFAIYKDVSGSSANLSSTRIFRDENAWYHFVIQNNNGTVTVYVNNETVSLSGSNLGTNKINAASTAHYVGQQVAGGQNFFGMISHLHFIDGTIYAPTVSGETDSTTGIWKIITTPSVTYGDDGFFILKDGNNLSGSTVQDQSGKGNNFTASGNLTDMKDCPDDVFATNNSIWKQESTRYLTHTKCNTMISGGGSSTWYQCPATLAFNSGKFYWECKFNAGTNLDKNTVGVIDVEKTQASGQFQDKTGSVFFKNEDGGDYRLDASNVDSNWGTLAQNDILGVAVDMDAGTPTVKYYKNGTLLGTVNASSLSGKFVTPAHMIYTSGEYQVNYCNGYFGTTAVSSAGTNASGIGVFEYDVPSGYSALSTKGLNL